MDKTPIDAFERLPQAKRLRAPLRQGDSAERTRGCRHTNPDICRNNSMPEVCAFVREDGFCLAPPLSWGKQYAALRDLGATGHDS